MRLSSHIQSCNYARKLLFLEQGDTQNLENFAETPVELQLFPHNGHEHIDADRDPDLSLHRVRGRPVERLDPQILLDPFEEQLHLPATLVELGNGHGREREAVGEEDESLAGLGIDIADAPEGIRTLPRGLGTGQHDGLVAAESGRFVDRPGDAASSREIALGAHHEERAALGHGAQASEIDVAAIHDVEGSWLREQQVEDGDIVCGVIGHVNERRNVAAQIEQRMEFHGSLALAEARLGKQRQAQVDRGGVEDVGGLRQGDPEVVLGVELPSVGNEHLCEVGVDSPIASLVRIREGAAGHRRPDARMIELRLECP